MATDERKRLAKANVELKKIMQQAAKDWLASQPDRDKLRVSPDHRVYVARPKGLGKVLSRLVMRIARDPIVRNQNNQELLKWVASEMSGYTPSAGLLDKPLSAKQIEKINRELTDMGRNPLPTGIVYSPSKIKMALRTRAKGGDTSARSYNPTIVITDKYVVVDNHSYSRSSDGKRIKAGRARLSVAGLEHLLTR